MRQVVIIKTGILTNVYRGLVNVIFLSFERECQCLFIITSGDFFYGRVEMSGFVRRNGQGRKIACSPRVRGRGALHFRILRSPLGTNPS